MPNRHLSAIDLVSLALFLLSGVLMAAFSVQALGPPANALGSAQSILGFSLPQPSSPGDLALGVVIATSLIAAGVAATWHLGRLHIVPIWLVLLIWWVSFPQFNPSAMPILGLLMSLGWVVGNRPFSSRLEARERDVEEMRRALRQGQIEFHYQPIIDMESGTPIGAEALARWRKPGEGVVPPGPWLDVLLGESLLEEFSRYQWGSVMEQAARWPQLRLNVNVAASQLADSGWAEDVLQRVRSKGAVPAQVCVEVTESTLLEDHPNVHRNLKRVRDAGVRVALDDFGSDRASVKTLMNFPVVNVVKIDKDLVQAADRAYAEVLIEIAALTDRQVVAEGVETEEQREWLQGLGVQVGQGWLWGKAVPAPVFPLPVRWAV